MTHFTILLPRTPGCPTNWETQTFSKQQVQVNITDSEYVSV